MVALDNPTFNFNPQLDQAYLDKLYGGNLGYALEMFELYLESVREGLIGLAEGLKQMDRRPIAYWVHKLRPCYAMVGLTDLFTDAKKLEEEGLEAYKPDQLFLEVSSMMTKSKDSIQLVSKEIARMKARMI